MENLTPSEDEQCVCVKVPVPLLDWRLRVIDVVNPNSQGGEWGEVEFFEV